MNNKIKFQFFIGISFLFMFFSLYLSYSSINKTSKMIDTIEKKHFTFSRLSKQLEQEIKKNQANILQSIVLKDINSTYTTSTSFNSIDKKISNLDNFAKEHNMNNNIVYTIKIIKKRMIGYKVVANSLVNALSKKSKEDLNDSLIGFNSITLKFSEDLNNLLNESKNILASKITDLKIYNDSTKKYIFYSFIITIGLIVFSVYRLNSLNNEVKEQLNRAEEAEKRQKQLQEKLLKYSDGLQKEVSRITNELQRNLYTQILSDLPNRNKLLEDMDTYKYSQIAILNIDKFQKFNDVYGEDIGNIAIKLSANFLSTEVDNSKMNLYHLSGDEFVIASKDIKFSNKQFFIEKIEKILNNFKNETFVYNDKTFHLIMSSGISFSGDKKILAYADMALKDAKRKNIQLSIFDDDKKLEKLHQEDIECQNKLNYAIEEKKILSFYQPITPIQDTTKPIKYESLVRIEDENGKIIPPFKFIDIAKANRIYHEITFAIINNSLKTIEDYKIPISINFGLKDLENGKTMKYFFDRLDEFDYNDLITVELLETEDIKNYTFVHDFCIKARSYGLKIALDDFGSGYSNFTHILNLPIDYIKIDASLISNIDRDIGSQIMVETIVGLAKKLDVETIAEFVSSKDIYDIVKELNVDYVQGYYLGKPEPIQNHINSLDA